MLALIKQVIKDCVTHSDGESYDIGRILLAVGVIAYIIMEAMDIHNTGTFECREWAEGLAYILGGGGALLWLKKPTEPGN